MMKLLKISDLTLPNIKKYSPRKVEKIWQELKKKFKNKSTISITIHGGYGKKNLGDDTILGVIIAKARKYFKNPKIRILCHYPREVKKIYDNISAYSFKNPLDIIKCLSSDIYIIGGGGIINKINTYSGFRRFKIFDPKGKLVLINPIFASLLGKPVFFYCIGATSVPDPAVKILARIALNRANYIVVRDPLSKATIMKIGVKKKIQIAFDPAVLVKPIPKKEATQILKKEGVKANKFLIGMSLRLVDEEYFDENIFVKDMCKIIDFYAERFNASILFVPFSRHPRKYLENDLNIARKIQRRIKNKDQFFILEGNYDGSQIKGVFKLCNLLILERLHAVILASPRKQPMIVISYDNKVTQFVKMSKQKAKVFTLKDFSREKYFKKVRIQSE